MPSGSRQMKLHARCPFYRSDDGKQKIICEGIVDDSTITLRYKFKADFDKQTIAFCCQHYKKCEIYRMLVRDKYGDEE